MAELTNESQFLFVRRPAWLPLRLFLFALGILFLLAPAAPLFSLAQWSSELAKWLGTPGLLFFGAMFVLAAIYNGQDIRLEPGTADLIIVTRYLFLPKYTQRFQTREAVAINYYLAEGVFRGTPDLSLRDTNGRETLICHVSRNDGPAVAQSIATALGIPIQTCK